MSDDDLTKDLRVRSPFSDSAKGIRSGSKEYWARWREANRERSRLYARRSQQRRIKLSLAAEVAAGANPETTVDIDKALAVVDEEVQLMRDVRAKLLAEGRIAPRDNVPIVQELAEQYKVPYDTAKKVMDEEPDADNWGVKMVLESQLRLEEVLGRPITEEELAKLEEDEPEDPA